MKDYTNLFSDILFYTKEYERLTEELKNPLLSESARQRLMQESARVKGKLDALVQKVPEISENL